MPVLLALVLVWMQLATLVWVAALLRELWKSSEVFDDRRARELADAAILIRARPTRSNIVDLARFRARKAAETVTRR